MIGSGFTESTHTIKTAILNPELEIELFGKSSSGETNTVWFKAVIAAAPDLKEDIYKKYTTNTVDTSDDLRQRHFVEDAITNVTEWAKELSDRITPSHKVFWSELLSGGIHNRIDLLTPNRKLVSP